MTPKPTSRKRPGLNPRVGTDKGDLVIRLDRQAITNAVDELLEGCGVSREDLIDVARIISRRVSR